MANKWVDDTVRCFISDAKDIEPTNPVLAIGRHYERNASDELKTKCAEDGKTPETCWRFIETVAREALHGRSGHIDPGVVYAIAMHYFQDVPANWDGAAKNGDDPASPPNAKRPKAHAKRNPDRPKRRIGASQGFFFDVLDENGGGGGK